MKSSSLVLLVLIGIAIAGCGTKLPNESDVANAWTEKTGNKVSEADVNNLNCATSVNDITTCHYQLNSQQFHQVLLKSDFGDWSIKEIKLKK